MTYRRAIAATLIGLATAFWLEGTSAQVPPHAPGTICFTPSFWCWAPQQGRPGAPCKCGEIDGVLG